MEIEIAKHDRMSESGSSLLRLIQNNNIPLLDLLVRESVQNSLDAAKDNTKSVKVDFITGKFNSDSLNSHFEKISQKLDKNILLLMESMILFRLRIQGHADLPDQLIMKMLIITNLEIC